MHTHTHTHTLSLSHTHWRAHARTQTHTHTHTNTHTNAHSLTLHTHRMFYPARLRKAARSGDLSSLKSILASNPACVDDADRVGVSSMLPPVSCLLVLFLCAVLPFVSHLILRGMIRIASALSRHHSLGCFLSFRVSIAHMVSICYGDQCVCVC